MDERSGMTVAGDALASTRVGGYVRLALGLILVAAACGGPGSTRPSTTELAPLTGGPESSTTLPPTTTPL